LQIFQLIADRSALIAYLKMPALPIIPRTWAAALDRSASALGPAPVGHARGSWVMKGIVTKLLAGAALAAPLTSTGCYHYQKCVDPCWPERYNAQARTEVIAAFAPQVQNGHVL